MTKEEFGREKAAFIVVETEKWEENRRLYNNESPAGYSFGYMRSYIRIKSINGIGLEDLLDVVLQEKEWTAKNQWRPGLDTYTHYDEEYSVMELVTAYSIPVGEEALVIIMRSKIRDFVHKLMFPAGECSSMCRCQSLKLFEDGSIDWETLKRITTTNCEA